MLRVILDFDGTLTAEEKQAQALAQLSIKNLAEDILDAPISEVSQAYSQTRERLLSNPQSYTWQVNGLIASYCNEGAFILNTTTVQTMLMDNPRYLAAVQKAFPDPEYDAVADCTNYLFHKHTPSLIPEFRPYALEVLDRLQSNPHTDPIILTNSLGDKVARFLAQTNLAIQPRILGDTRQYDMDPNWRLLGQLETSASFVRGYPIDLRRPAYHKALTREAANGVQLLIIADTFSMPGALPLVMGIPFVLLHTEYTPEWCLQAVQKHPLGYIIDELTQIYTIAESLLQGNKNENQA